MSDWGMYELEDIVWDKFGGSDDHIVPHPGGTALSNCVHKGDCHKRPWNEVTVDVERIAGGKTSVTKNVLQGKEKTTFHSALGEDRKAPMLEKGSWSNEHESAFPASCDSDCVNLATDSVDTRTASNCFTSSNVDSVSSEFCTDDPILGNGGAAVDNLCRFQLDDISATGSDLEFFGNGHSPKESSDLLDYGWPDIGNFEDIDRMFRNCDSTFGQGNTVTVNELPWDCSDDTFKLGFRSSCSEGRGLSTPANETDPDHLAITGFDEKKGSNTFKKGSWDSDTNDFCTYASWFDTDTENKGESASIDQAHEDNGSDEVKISTHIPISDGSSVAGCRGMDLESRECKQSKNREHFAGKRKVRSSEYMNGTLCNSGPTEQFSDCKLAAPMSSSSQVLSQQGQLLESNSFKHLHAYISRQHQECGHPLHQFPVITTGSSVKSETKNLPPSYKVLGYASNNSAPLEVSSNHLPMFSTTVAEDKVAMLDHPQQIRAAMSNEHQHEHYMSNDTCTDQARVQKQLSQLQDEVGGGSEVVETGVEFAATEIDSSTVQESSCMSSVLSNEISLEATSFQQLQDVLEELDVRTKLCIRDSLYRLAKSAKQRHNFKKTNSSSRDRRSINGTPAAGESNKCLGFMDPETNTNPIDRSVAHLLFHRPSVSSTRPSNDALSLESQGIIHAPLTNLHATHDHQFFQEYIACDADMKLPITEQ